MSVSRAHDPVSLRMRLLVFTVFAAIAAVPFLHGTDSALETGMRISVFIVLAAAFDLLLGLAGLVSFAQGIFFGLGALGLALSSIWFDGAAAFAVGAAVGVAGAGLFACALTRMSMRADPARFAMLSFVIAGAIAAGAGQLTGLTGWEAQMEVVRPTVLQPGQVYAKLPEYALAVPAQFGGVARVGGGAVSGTTLLYLTVCGMSLLLFLTILRIAGSSFAMALRAARAAPDQAEALGIDVSRLRARAVVVSSAISAIAGALLALWLGEMAPASFLGVEVPLTVLAIAAIGGAGSVVGAVPGAVIVVLAVAWTRQGVPVPDGFPTVAALLSPERWPIWQGLVLIVFPLLVPRGLTGLLQGGSRSRRG